jgi:hypothetical protein
VKSRQNSVIANHPRTAKVRTPVSLLRFRIWYSGLVFEFVIRYSVCRYWACRYLQLVEDIGEQALAVGRLVVLLVLLLFAPVPIIIVILVTVVVVGGGIRHSCGSKRLDSEESAREEGSDPKSHLWWRRWDRGTNGRK